MVTVKFHGDLKRFEPSDAEIVLCVDNFRELMSGLLSQIQGLRQHLRQGYYKVRIGRDRYFSEAQIKSNAALPLDENCTVHFTPVVAGAGKNMNIANIVIGVVLIAASWYAGGAAGWSYLGAQGYMGATMAFAMGTSMIMSGAIGLLSRPPDMTARQGVGASDKENKRNNSTSFSNIQNLTPQGRPIPLLYGKMMTSLILISQGVETFDEISAPAQQAQAEAHKVYEKKVEQAKAVRAEINRINEERAERARDNREVRDDERREERERRERISKMAENLF